MAQPKTSPLSTFFLYTLFYFEFGKDIIFNLCSAHQYSYLIYLEFFGTSIVHLIVLFDLM